jgi:hypothetical protein
MDRRSAVVERIRLSVYGEIRYEIYMMSALRLLESGLFRIHCAVDVFLWSSLRRTRARPYSIKKTL